MTVKLNGIDATMEVDTGDTLSIISEQTYKTLFTTVLAPRLEASAAHLKSYNGEEINIIIIRTDYCYGILQQPRKETRSTGS